MKRKKLLTLISAIMCIFFVGITTASADEEGIYTYSVSNGEVTITDCEDTVSGELIIPNTLGGYPVKSIGKNAFKNCVMLTDVIIPEGVTSIGYESFQYCSGLASVTIPSSVTTVSYSAFGGCNGISDVYIKDIEAWCKIDFNNSSSTSNPLYYADNLYVNGKLTRNIVIPDTIKVIKSNTFSYFTGIVSVVIPDSVTSIGGSTFKYCTGLTKVTIPDSVVSIGVQAFYNCTGLINITIPGNVTSIGGSAFYDCTGLKSITIPESVTSIGSSAFCDCSGLLEVYIADIESWCNINFGNAYSNPLYYADNLYVNGTLARDIIIPDSVKAIKDYAFNCFTGIAKLTIGNGVESIGYEAFKNCTGLTSVIIGDNVTNIGNSAFYGCSGLVKATIGSSVTNIGDSAFRNCSGLAEINIPDSVISIGSSVFYDCDSIKSLTVPYSVTSIGNGAFKDCSGLKTIIVESGVDLIPESAFYNCSNLKYVYLPSEVLYIRNNAFSGCSNILEVFYEGSAEQWEEILFYNGNTSLTNAKIIYSPEKRTFKFETNCGTKLADITDYAVFFSPTVTNEGKTLAGWYDNKELSGTPVTFPYYGKATTLYAAWIDRSGLSYEDAFVAKENKQYTVTTTESGQVIYYEFVPEFTGEYRFYSTGSLNTVGYLYNSSKKQLTNNDNGGEGNNFYIVYNLNAGEIYYIATKLYSGTGTFTLVTETDCVPGTKTVCVTASTGEKIFISIPSYLPDESMVILACYKDGRFVEMKTAPNKNETIYFIVNNGFDSAKVMVWEDFESMEPICTAETVL